MKYFKPFPPGTDTEKKSVSQLPTLFWIAPNVAAVVVSETAGKIIKSHIF